MVTIPDLWAPILLSAVLVFIASFISWAVLPFHRKDFRGLPDEAALAEALRRQGVQPGQYNIPHAGDPKRMKDPEFVKRMREGPVAILSVTEPRDPGMGKDLAKWFAYVLAVTIFVAYMVSRTLAPEADYLQVFRIAGTTAVVAYSAAVIPNGIWFGWPWGHVWRNVLDGIVYGLLTAGSFGWLWPR